jgi:hypothetical protein
VVKRYFKGPGEPGSDETEYIEFTDGRPTRQIDVVDGNYYSSLDPPVRDEDGWVLGGGLTDQPMEAPDIPPDAEITAEEFEEAWQRMLAARERQGPAAP